MDPQNERSLTTSLTLGMAVMVVVLVLVLGNLVLTDFT